jgi:thiamine-phosphate pyrophosphorylase
MSEPFSAPTPGAAVVCLHDGCVLLIRRAREPNRGRWSFPGGRVEPGETARACAEREALEEAGLRVRVLDPVDVYDALFPPYHYTVADYLAEPAGSADLRPGGDVLDARWVPFEELAAYEVTEAMEAVLRRARWLDAVRRGAPAALGMPTPAPPAPVRGVYVITDARLHPGRDHRDIARAALAGGAAAIQLRDKTTDAGLLLPAAREISAWCRAAGALFLVNDRVDLALAAEADGVHVGQTDLPAADVRRQLGPRACVGVSVENAEQARAAEAAGADYLGVGPIYGTATKADAGSAVGLEHLRRIREATRLPVVAIGGLTAARLPETRAAGADAAAVIGAVALADDMVAAVRRLAVAWGDD